MRQPRAVFLDRDGVLNAAIVKDGKPSPPTGLNEIIIPSDVPQALKMLKRAGFLLFGATNQPDVARGTTPRDLVETINQHLIQQLGLDDIRVCFHDDGDQCSCRKPLPGLLYTLATEYQIDLKNSFMIGDRWKDITAGQRAGCKTIWLDHQYKEARPEKPPNFTTTTLQQATDWIVNNYCT